MTRPKITLEYAEYVTRKMVEKTNLSPMHGFDIPAINQAVINSRKGTEALRKCNPADAKQLSIRSLTQYNGYKVRVTLDNGQIVTGQLDKGWNGWQVWKDGQVRITFRTSKETVINTRPNGRREIRITGIKVI